ncbi:MAG: hypothetical protein HY077_00295 [Elusimicrobia bacterium]|nr:hypothetical protein [Elusimicrobiota bacterium]
MFLILGATFLGFTLVCDYLNGQVEWFNVIFSGVFFLLALVAHRRAKSVGLC